MGMRPVTVETEDASGGVKASRPIPVNWRKAPFQLGLQVTTDGTVDYDVQYTLDDIRAEGWDPATANWLPCSQSLDGATSDASETFDIPCTALRLVQNDGSGSVLLRIVSAGK